MDDPLYERLLVMRAQLGDEQALAELIAHYSPRLTYFLRKLRGGEAVDDVLQEVWLAVFRSLPRLGAAEAFRTWLYRIARDQACTHLRRDRRTPRTVADAATLEVTVETDEFTADDIAAVHRALDDLPPEQREALVLRFIEGMSYDEIAQVTRTPLGTVRSRLYYGKLTLRAKLSGD